MQEHLHGTYQARSLELEREKTKILAKGREQKLHFRVYHTKGF